MVLLKKATFPLNLPGGTYTTFDLYGVYGGGGFSNTPGQEHLVVLPTLEQATSGALSDIQDNKAFVLTFAVKDIKKTNPSVSANFEHLGSLFRIILKNIGWYIKQEITEARLVASTDIPALINQGNATYDIISGTYNGTSTSEKALLFPRLSADLTPSGTLQFWGWYIPTGDAWPALSLRIKAKDGPDEGYYVSFHDKPQRAAAPVAGKAYHFYAAIVNNNVAFADEHFVTNMFWDDFIDTRDGNTYKTIIIGNQIWMAENMRYLYYVYAPTDGSVTSTRYYVYEYSGTNNAEAKAHPNYQTLGVLYNWRSARGACPAGWHLPTDSEWEQLRDYLIVNGYNFDGTVTGNKVAKSMATTSGWTSDSSNGVVGNTDYPDYRNKSGFSALPAGYRSASGFDGIDSYTAWWSRTEYDEQHAKKWYFDYAGVALEETYNTRDHGFSVRCIKD